MITKEFQDYFSVWNKLTAAQQEQLEHAVRYEHAKKGTIIHNGSLDCVGVLLIHSGQLRAYMISEEGREITVLRLLHDAEYPVRHHHRSRKSYGFLADPA